MSLLSVSSAGVNAPASPRRFSTDSSCSRPPVASPSPQSSRLKVTRPGRARLPPPPGGTSARCAAALPPGRLRKRVGSAGRSARRRALPAPAKPPKLFDGDPTPPRIGPCVPESTHRRAQQPDAPSPGATSVGPGSRGPVSRSARRVVLRSRSATGIRLAVFRPPLPYGAGPASSVRRPPRPARRRTIRAQLPFELRRSGVARPLAEAAGQPAAPSVIIIARGPHSRTSGPPPGKRG